MLLIYGELMWVYLYCKMMFILVDVGFNVIVLDFIGFGCLDKLVRKEDYFYVCYVIWLKDWFL